MFTDVSHLVGPVPPGRYSCAVVFDVDGDGSNEVFLGRLDGPNRVLKWVGGMLRDVTPAALADPLGPATAAAAADLDGDGREELYVGTAAGCPDRLFDTRPDGSWEDLFVRPENLPLRNANPVVAVAALDRRGSGRYGFVVAAEEFRLRLVELAADDRLADLAPAVGLDRGSEFAFTHLLPVPLLTARTDLFVSNRHDANLFLTPTPDGTFTDVAWRCGLAYANAGTWAATPAPSGPTLGLVVAATDDEHSLWMPRPDGTFGDIASPAFSFPSAPYGLVVADFDNDGAAEVLFLNRGEPNRLFRPDPLLTDPGVLATPLGPGAVAAADFDDDGRMELLIVAYGSVHLFRAVHPAGPAARIIPLTRFGGPARGAAVRLESASRSLRSVVPGTGPLEPIVHFGLGPDPAPATVTATWPDGVHTRVPAPPPGAVLHIPYPGG